MTGIAQAQHGQSSPGARPAPVLPPTERQPPQAPAQGEGEDREERPPGEPEGGWRGHEPDRDGHQAGCHRRAPRPDHADPRPDLRATSTTARAARPIAPIRKVSHWWGSLPSQGPTHAHPVTEPHMSSGFRAKPSVASRTGVGSAAAHGTSKANRLRGYCSQPLRQVVPCRRCRGRRQRRTGRRRQAPFPNREPAPARRCSMARAASTTTTAAANTTIVGLSRTSRMPSASVVDPASTHCRPPTTASARAGRPRPR